MMKKLLRNERGDVIQFILVLAVVAIILAFAFPKFKSAMASGAESAVKNIDCAFSSDLQPQDASLDQNGIYSVKSSDEVKCK